MQPYDFEQAAQASREATQQQRIAEDGLRTAGRELADANRAYRMALSLRMAEKRNEGIPATVAKDQARGDEDIADLEHALMYKEVLKDAASQALWTHAAERRELEHLIDWSKRASFLDLSVGR